MYRYFSPYCKYRESVLRLPKNTPYPLGNPFFYPGPAYFYIVSIQSPLSFLLLLLLSSSYRIYSVNLNIPFPSNIRGIHLTTSAPSPPSSSIYVIMSCHRVIIICIYITNLIRIHLDNIYVTSL